MHVCRNSVEAIGRTPLIRLTRASQATGCEIFGKAEFMNPGGSVKDRAALYIVKDAEERGLLRPGGVIVEGTAVSQQAKRRASIDQWKARIIEASRDILPEGHFATEVPLAATLFYFPAAEMQGDVDNIVKPILDALTKHIYMNDRQIQRILVQKFEPGNVFEFALPGPVLGDALSRPKPVLYVRISDDPFEDLA